jgi:hypothetical protein
MLAPPLAATVSSVMSLGFTARETIPIVFCGFALCSGALTLTGKMGATYNIPFPVLSRSIFGMYGSYPIIVLRSFGKCQDLVSMDSIDKCSSRGYVDRHPLRPGGRLPQQLPHGNLAELCQLPEPSPRVCWHHICWSTLLREPSPAFTYENAR